MAPPLPLPLAPDGAQQGVPPVPPVVEFELKILFCRVRLPALIKTAPPKPPPPPPLPP